jgi:hypothetical protein
MFAFLLAIVIEPVAAVADDPPRPPHIFLHPSDDDCGRPTPSDEVVVCGAKDKDERYRLRPIEKGIYRDEPVRAEMSLGAGKLSAHNEDKEVAPGIHSKRAMITFTLPF